MGTLGLKIDDDLEERFRRKVFERKGMKKGNITEALEEAIEVWMAEDYKLRKEGERLAKK